MGSDINDERLRFDFSFERKLTPEEIKAVEDLVNLKIKEGLVLKKEVMPLSEALSSGALSFFKERYPEEVSVWTIYDKDNGEIFSKEICGGEHIDNVSKLESFKIIKEESSSRGVRRIKAICQGKYTI
jgi:alanyl-tRNA synthetase